MTPELREPLTLDQIEACRIEANKTYKRFVASVRGQIVMPEDDWEYHYARAIEQALRAKLPRWIPVTERLPVRYECVFAARTVYRSLYYAAHADVWIDLISNSELEGVTHWMPLPPAPKQEPSV